MLVFLLTPPSVVRTWSQFDLKAIILSSDPASDRERASSEVYELLSGIPIEDLASNGESMVSATSDQQSKSENDRREGRGTAGG